MEVGSDVSEAVVPLLGMYSASKHAVKGFTDALRVEIETVDKAPVSITLIQPTAVDTPFPQHGKNYMEQEPKLPTPMIEPQQVADAILDAAVTPTRNKKVGVMATLNTLVAKLIPSLGQWMSSKQVDRMQYDEPPRNPDGALHQPSEVTHVVGRPPMVTNQPRFRASEKWPLRDSLDTRWAGVLAKFPPSVRSRRRAFLCQFLCQTSLNRRKSLSPTGFEPVTFGFGVHRPK